MTNETPRRTGTPAQRALAADRIKLSRQRPHRPRGRAAVWPAGGTLALAAADRLVEGQVAEATDFAVAWRLCLHIATGTPSTTPFRDFRRAAR